MIERKISNTDSLKKSKKKSRCKCYIDPDSNFSKRWAILMLFSLMYVATVMPFNISFLEETQGFNKFCETGVDIFFILDIFYNLLVAYREDDELITSNKRIVLNYMKGWFFFDFVASFPTSTVIKLIIDSKTGEVTSASKTSDLDLTKLIKIPRISRLSRLARVMKVFSFIKKNPYITKLKDDLNVSAAFMRLI